MKMLFKGHSTRLEMLIEKMHSNKESSYQDSEISGSISSEIRPTSIDNSPEINSESPKSQSFSDTEDEKDWDEIRKYDEISVVNGKSVNGLLQFTCPYCPRQFKHKRSKDRHIKLHTGDKKYKCIQCESAFARSDHLKIHMKTHDLKKQYRCLRCNKGYNTVSAFSFHEKSHKTNFSKMDALPSLLAEDVDNSELSENKIFWHNSRENECDEPSDIKTICVYCFQWFSSLELMREHIQVFHQHLDGVKKYNLKINIPENQKDSAIDIDLQKTENDVNGLKRPKENTVKEISRLKLGNYGTVLGSPDAFICSCCFERFPNFKTFLVHMETHVSAVKSSSHHKCAAEANDDLPIANSSMIFLNKYICCCHCNSYFEDSNKLHEHLLEHHVITMYKCSLCKKSFDDLPSMKIHMTAKHIHANEHFECNCSEVPKLFHDRMTAELHFARCHSTKSPSEHQSHSDINRLSHKRDYFENIPKSVCLYESSSHQCIYCKEYCKTKTDLQSHLRSHQIAEKSRQKCNICDETFRSPGELASHKLSHCKIIQGNVCVQCKTILMDEESFVKHQLKHNDNSKSVSRSNSILLSICIICGQTLQTDKEIELHANFHLKFLSEQSESKVIEIQYSDDTTSATGEKLKKTGTILDDTLELQCHLCKKTFVAKDKLQIHLIEHNFFGINQFSCYVCSSVFTAAAGLHTHLIAHNLSEKPYQCSNCSAGFFFRAELENHKYLHNFRVQFDC